ncbi:MAG: hypothetical protein JRJ65_06235 [Deltaproteobacteria bacterium]|nr:hypothetical protein [Deltaproteobacteria bacterium]
MDHHRIPVGYFRRHNPKEKIQRIEYRRFEMAPKGDATKNIGIPVRDAMVLLYLINQELLKAKIESKKIGTKEEMPAKDDILKEKQTVCHQD